MSLSIVLMLFSDKSNVRSSNSPLNVSLSIVLILFPDKFRTDYKTIGVSNHVTVEDI